MRALLADGPFVNPDFTPVHARATHETRDVCAWTAAFLCFAIPWSDLFLLPLKVQFTRPLSVVAMLIWIVSARIGNRARPMGAAVFAMFLFVAFCPANFLITEDPERTSRRVLSYYGTFLLVLFLRQAVQSVETYQFLLKSLVAGCAVSLAGLAYNVLRGHEMGDGRYTAPHMDPNDLAAQLVFSITIATYLVFRRTKGSALLLAYIPFAVSGVLLTGSRAGLVIFGVCALYPLSALLRLKFRARCAVLVAIAASFVAVQAVAPDISFDRLRTTNEQITQLDMNGRGAIWTAGMEMFWQSPALGIGAGAFGSSVNVGTRVAAHNTYLEVLVEHGALGLLLFALISLTLLAVALTFAPEDRKMWLFLLSALAIMSATLSWENREMTWLIWGLCASYIRPAGEHLVCSLESPILRPA
jgi:O-antigen ligase